MENTKENKTKFFAQYYEQEVLAGTQGAEKQIAKLTQNWNWEHDSFYLILTPLSKITDEDAIEVAKLWHHPYPPSSGKKWCVQSLKKNNELIPFIVVDFIRHKGYAYEWMGLSVEKQIEYGWIKLKQ